MSEEGQGGLDEFSLDWVLYKMSRSLFFLLTFTYEYMVNL